MQTTIYLPVKLIKSDEIYTEMMLTLLYMGITPSANDKDINTSILKVDYIYQDIFPKLIYDKLRIENSTCWIEIDNALLDEPNGIDSEDERSLKEYVLTYYENKDTNKALILVSRRDKDALGRTDHTTSEELYKFINKFKKDDLLSNVFIETSVIASKKEEYNKVGVEV